MLTAHPFALPRIISEATSGTGEAQEAMAARKRRAVGALDDLSPFLQNDTPPMVTPPHHDVPGDGGGGVSWASLGDGPLDALLFGVSLRGSVTDVEERDAVALLNWQA